MLSQPNLSQTIWEGALAVTLLRNRILHLVSLNIRRLGVGVSLHFVLKGAGRSAGTHQAQGAHGKPLGVRLGPQSGAEALSPYLQTLLGHMFS